MKRFLSILLTIFLLPSYLISLLPSRADTDFAIPGDGIENGKISVNGESVAVEVNNAGKISYGFNELRGDWFNYFGIKYTSDAHMKGEIVYTRWGSEYTEEFFLEPAEEAADFRSFIDGFLDKKKSNTLCRITVEPLDKDTADFELLGVGLFNREVLEREVFISTDKVKIGVDLQWGGALSYLEDLDSDVQAVEKNGRIFVDSNAAERYGVKSVNDNVNLINRFDPGRLVQQSYYGTFGGGYENGEFMGNQWNYNPVQGGNQFGDSSKIVDIIATENLLYVKCRPLDWALPADRITPSYMEAEYTINGSSVNVSCRFVDFSGYPSYYTSQEIPAFYCIEPFNRFVYCKDGEISYENSLIFWPDAGYPKFFSNENWSAFIGEFDDSFGIGIYVPGIAEFLSGVFDREKTSNTDPSVDGPTSYIAAIKYLDFMSYTPIEYNYTIATGTVSEMRAAFNAAAANE